MKTSHLRHFLVAAEVLHFPVAADKLGISRQKLESSIEALELEFGTKLFDRNATPYRLTKAGQAAVVVAEEELASPSRAFWKMRSPVMPGRFEMLWSSFSAALRPSSPLMS